MCFLVGLAIALGAATVAWADEAESIWFVWQPEEDGRESVLDASGMLEAPAGQHGYLQFQDDRLVYEDGTPTKIWGVNISSDSVMPSPEEGRHWATMLAKYGYNSVRFHKFMSRQEASGISDDTDSTKVDPEKADLFDRFHSELTQRGLMVGWSPIYGHLPKPGDRDRLVAYDELANNGRFHLKGSIIGLVNFFTDIQDLQIDAVVNLLERRNEHTGLRYADDPALAFVEMQNEDNVYFPTAFEAIEACPTYKRIICQQFSDWLAEKYGDHDGLVAAWGPGAMDAFPEYMQNERLEDGNIYPLAHCFRLGNDALADEVKRKRLLDTLRFLYDKQNEFYYRFAEAIRETGYRGYLVASCWQAGEALPNYYNLHNDYLQGAIDRHAYWGGLHGHIIEPGKNKNQSMLTHPGRGLLRLAVQQVEDRPFVISEWISRYPNEWIAEGPPIVAAYGLGLHGWDASYHFDHELPWVIQNLGAYSALNPSQLGQSAALSRMVLGDHVKEGQVLHSRNVHIPSLAEGRLGFEEREDQIEGERHTVQTVPLDMLAAGRIVVSFTDEFEETVEVDPETYRKAGEDSITSTTGQLRWDTSGDGYFTINTDGTQAVVGHAGGQTISLPDCDITIANPFAVVYVSSLDPSVPIRDSESLLVTALARTRNSGAKWSPGGDEFLEVGKPPVEAEGVRATIRLRNGKGVTVTPLDQAGVRTDESVAVQMVGEAAEFTVDGGEHETFYFEVRR